MSKRAVSLALLLSSITVTSVAANATLLRTPCSVHSSKQQTQRYFLNGVAFRGAKSLTTRQLLAVCKFRRGSTVTDDDLSRSAALVASAYVSKGFSRVRVMPSKRNLRTFASEGRMRIDVVFDIEEGPRFLISALEVVGTSVTQDRIVLRVIGIKPWDPYDPKAVDAAIRRLNRIHTLDVVKKEDVEIKFDESKHVVDLRFRLRERL